MNQLPPDAPLHASERFRSEVRRRDFLGLAALWSFLTTGVVMLAGALRLPMPSIFPETGSKFRIGPPSRFPPGAALRIAERNVLVMRDARGLRALSLVCTHLGCITGREESGAFVCPCHGSRFDAEGRVTQGPAPSRLRYLAISRAPSGDLLVDRDSPVDAEWRLEV